jgi:hypothetical protein
MAVLLGILPAFAPAAPVRAAPTTYYVNMGTDGYSAAVTDCAVQANTDCTLRDALQAANTNVGADTVVLKNLITYALTLGPTGSDDNTTGDLNITDSVAIVVSGNGEAIIDAGGMTPTRDRVLTVSGGTVGITGVTVRNGETSGSGGGVLNTGGILTLIGCVISNNQAQDSGGGFANVGVGANTILQSSIVSGNSMTSSGAFVGGGGIYNASGGQVAVTNSSIAGNTANGLNSAGGGIYNINNGTQMTLTNTVVSGNQTISTNGDGGGIENFSATLIVQGGSNIDTNIARRDGGGIAALLGQVTVTASSVSTNQARGNGLANSGVGGGIESSGATLTIQGGSTIAGNIANYLGGGIDNSSLSGVNGRVTVDSSVIGGTDGNTAGLSGGGIANHSSGNILTVRNGSQIIGNIANGTAAAAQGGGGIYNAGGGQVTLTGSTVTTNSTTSGVGGGIYNTDTGSQTTITNCTISNNKSHDGGGIRNFSATTQVTDSTISGNTVSGLLDGFNNGGGISNGGTVTVTRTTVTGNTAGDSAGGIGVGHSGSLTLQDSTVSNNSAGNGGGIQNFNESSTVTMTSTTVSGNHATSGNGGGIRNLATLNATGSTISGNTATGTGGGITYIGTVALTNVTIASNSTGINNSGGTLTLKNALIGSNTSGDCTGSIPSADYNLASDATCTGFTQPHDRTDVAPLIAALGDYGGQTQTHAPLPGSPAIDAGSCASGYRDQRGIPQVGAACDIGAVESQGFTMTLAGGSGQSTAATTAFPNPLAVTVASAHNEPVAGGHVTFTGPANGAGILGSPLTGTITATGSANATATANSTVGAYTVAASAAGAAATTLNLTNVPLLAAISPASGGTTGGNHVTLTGAGYAPGATVTIGGVACTNVQLLSSTTLTCIVPAHEAGVVGVAVTLGTQTGTLANGYSYGAVHPLPQQEPKGGTGSGAGPLPNARPAGGAPGGSAQPLPNPRP